MKLLLLLDKKPGHFRQTEGVAQAFARRVPVEVVRLKVRARPLVHNSVLLFVMRRLGRNSSFWLRHLYGIEAGELVRPDAIIGSGRPTVAAGILLSRLFHAPFVYSGQIAGYDTTDVALQLVASPRSAWQPNSVWVPVPSVIDPDAFPAPRALRQKADLAGATVALFIGGDSHGHTFVDAEWHALGDFIRRSTRELGLRWRVSTSRRSPAMLSPLFAAMAAEGAIEEFIDYRSAGAGSGDRLFAADAIVVTEDSQSMVAEALAARRTAIALRPASVKTSSADEVVAALAARGSVAVMPIGSLTTARFAEALLSLHPPVEDARDAIAAALAPVFTRKLLPRASDRPG